MGNCIDSRGGATWVDDDDWGFSDEDERKRSPLLGKKGSAAAEAAAVGPREVKIKITKKQLRELLRKAEGKGVPADEVVAELAWFVEFGREHRESHWKPALQSIPETGE
ncbi:uncharacterized protein LOC109712486 [Ananas comosus]|uniref:Uncharacterized protein LOC109712486 n=1 Tax=Ananas comosus TaxID=4615 RepID=A0A6P5F7S3_ANACO|nr:uncharacterized protein LOC109712486 [Ananas comosus]